MDLFLSLSTSSLLNRCKYNLAEYCNNETLWEKRTLQDFNNTNKPQEFSWKQFYFHLSGDQKFLYSPIKRISGRLYS